ALRRGTRVLRLDLAEALPIPGPELLREERVRIVGEHRDPVEAAGVAHVGAVPALRHAAVHPGDEVAAVAASTGKHALAVHITAPGEQRGGRLDVRQLALAEFMPDGLAEILAERRRAVEIDAGDDVALRREDLVVPAEVPRVRRNRLRRAVDRMAQRGLLPRVEARREHQPHLHRFAAPAAKAELLRRAELKAPQQRVVERLRLALDRKST